jgi:antitoxin MazE
MKVHLIQIGNSKGVRIPRSVIKECGFGEEIEMRVEHGTVVLAPARATREGWDGAFERMAAAHDDTLLVPDTIEHEWDKEEWEW